MTLHVVLCGGAYVHKCDSGKVPKWHVVNAYAWIKSHFVSLIRLDSNPQKYIVDSSKMFPFYMTRENSLSFEDFRQNYRNHPQFFCRTTTEHNARALLLGNTGYDGLPGGLVEVLLRT